MEKNIIENDIETFMLDKANEMGFEFLKFISPGHKGVPDRILVGYGCTAFVELKRSEDTDPRTSQKHMINKLIDKGAFVYVVGSNEQAVDLLTKIKNGHPPKPVKFKQCRKVFDLRKDKSE